jgi:hypothetical protein
VNRELIEQDLDVHPDQLLTSQEIAVVDLRLAEAILMTWLPSLDMLKEPKHCEIPI